MLEKKADDAHAFHCPVKLSGESPWIKSDVLLGHAVNVPKASPSMDAEAERMRGMKELFTSYDTGLNGGDERPMWMPGSTIAEEEQNRTQQPVWWSIDRYGHWQYAASENIAE